MEKRDNQSMKTRFEMEFLVIILVFASCNVHVDAMEAALSKKFVPKNTTTSTKWAVLNFVAWRNGRNAQDQIHDTQQFENAELEY